MEALKSHLGTSEKKTFGVSLGYVVTPCKVICQKVRPTGVSKESLLGHHITPKRKSPKGVLTLFTGTCQKVRPTGVSKKNFFWASELRNMESTCAKKRRLWTPYCSVMMLQKGVVLTPLWGGLFGRVTLPPIWCHFFFQWE